MGKPLQSATTVKLPWTTFEGLLVCVELDLNLFQIQDSIQQGANRATGEGVFERELHLQVSRITQRRPSRMIRDLCQAKEMRAGERAELAGKHNQGISFIFWLIKIVLMLMQ